MSDKIKVISCVDGRCGVDNFDLRISRVWEKRGDIQAFTKEQIEELMFDASFKNMVNAGMLFIDDMPVKKELGIEPEEAKEPTIKQLSDQELNNMWKTMTLTQFKLATKNLTSAQKTILANYAMKHGNDGTIEKANYLESISGYKILKGIELDKLDKED